MNWIVLVTAPDQITAEMWVDLLRGEGIPAQVHPGDVTGFLGVSPLAARVMVHEAEAERAREYLDEIADIDGVDEP